MKSSTKPEVHNVLYCRQKRTEPRPQATCTQYYNILLNLDVWFFIWKRRDRQTDTQTRWWQYHVHLPGNSGTEPVVLSLHWRHHLTGARAAATACVRRETHRSGASRRQPPTLALLRPPLTCKMAATEGRSSQVIYFRLTVMFTVLPVINRVAYFVSFMWF